MHPEQAEVAELLGELAREDPFLEPARDLGQHAVADPAADGVAQHQVLVAEQVVQPEDVLRVELRGR